VELTAEGKRLAASCFEKHAKDLEALMSALSEKEKEQAYRLLKKLGLLAAKKLDERETKFKRSKARATKRSRSWARPQMQIGIDSFAAAYDDTSLAVNPSDRLRNLVEQARACLPESRAESFADMAGSGGTPQSFARAGRACSSFNGRNHRR
jgi:DNA-binding transcriptional ArsR family regulator